MYNKVIVNVFPSRLKDICCYVQVGIGEVEVCASPAERGWLCHNHRADLDAAFPIRRTVVKQPVPRIDCQAIVNSERRLIAAGQRKLVTIGDMTITYLV